MEEINGKERQELLDCLSAMFSYYVSTVNWKETKARYKKATEEIRQIIKGIPIKE